MRDRTALAPGSCQLLVIDMQTRLAAAMPEARRGDVVAAARLLGTAAAQLGVPATVTEHVPEAIGSTAPEVLRSLDRPTVLGKVHFGAANEPALVEHLGRVDRRCLVVCGMETHVCVLQTAMGLTERGYRVALVADASCSRRARDEELALDRARQHGIEVVSAEMVVFEWLHRADHPARRTLIAAIKTRGGA